jgi:polyhydroxyalkanoate synthesis regulator phasin
MAEQRKDLLTRLAEAGEDAIQRLSDMPGASRVTDAMNTLRERVDELQRRVRGMDELERRVAALERRVDELAGEKGTGRRRTTPARTRAATSRRTTRRTAKPSDEGTT